MKELIRAQESTEVGLAERLLEQLEKEIAELRKRDAELAKLSETEDHVSFLQVTFPAMWSPTYEGLSSAGELFRMTPFG